MASRLLVHNVCEHWTREQGSNVCRECRHHNGGYREASAEEVTAVFLDLLETSGAAETVRMLCADPTDDAGADDVSARRELLAVLGLGALLEPKEAPDALLRQHEDRAEDLRQAPARVTARELREAE